ARVGHEALMAVRDANQPLAEDVVNAAQQILRDQLRGVGVEVVSGGGHRIWQGGKRLGRGRGGPGEILNGLNQNAGEEGEGAAEHLLRHVEARAEWLQPSRSMLQIAESRLVRLALIAAFSPALSLLRACESVYGENATDAALGNIAELCLGPMRRYFNRPVV